MRRKVRVVSLWACAMLAEGFVRFFSLPLALRMGQALGRIVGRLAAPFHKTARHQLDLCYGDSMPPAAKSEVVLGMFEHLGRSVFELLKMKNMQLSDFEPQIQVEGLENLELARAKGRGILIVTGHLGNWELMAAWVAGRIPLMVLARDLPNWLLNRWLVDCRARFGVRTVYRGDFTAAKEALTSLRRGEAVGILIDQDTKVDGDFVPFFGRPAFTPTGAAALALRTGAALLPSYTITEKHGHRIVFEPPRWIEEQGDKKEIILRHTAWLTERIESWIRKNPKQWVWLHRRFKTLPPSQSHP